LRFVSGVSQILGPLTVDVDALLIDRHPVTAVILCVESEHARWSDYDMVDVSAFVTHGNSVEDAPLFAQLSQAPCNFLFTIGSHAPVPFIALDAQDPGQD
jgi:hypothetical protein